MRMRYAWLVAVLSVAGLSAAGTQVKVVDAVKAGNRDLVKTLLQQHADVNAPESDGMTAIHWAVRADDAQLVQMLIKAGANVKAASRYGVTPLSLAATNGNASMVQTLLKAGADPNAATTEHETVLMTAARTGSAEAVKALVAYGAEVNAKDLWQEQTALMWAASENNAAAVKALVEVGADVNARSKELSFPEFKFVTSGMVTTVLPRGNWTALMYAARNGSIDAARALADAKVDINAKDPDGSTALMLAIINFHFDTAIALLDKGADPNLVDSTGTGALYSAVDMSTMAPMMSRPSPKLVDSTDAPTLVKALLAHGANPNARLKRPIIGRHHTPNGDATLGEGTTPLARATKGNDLPVMRLLLDAGADPTLTLKDRTTVVMIAAAGGNTVGGYAKAIPVTEESSLEAVKMAVERGVDVNAFTAGGNTAMHTAVTRGATSIVSYLADHGAKLDMRDKQGRTPLDIAMGVGGANAGRRGGGGNNNAAAGRGGNGAGQARMVALVRDLMAKQGLDVPAAPQAQ